MYRKVAVIAASAVAVVGVGTAVAVAASGSNTTSGLPGTAPTTSTSASPGAKTGKAGKHGHHGDKGHGLLKRLEHGTVVVQGKDGKPQTITLIRGTVTAVSASSITVQAADKTTQTYAVTKDTKVRTHTASAHGKTTIDKVAKGDHALVAGTGSGTLTATQVVDTGTK